MTSLNIENMSKIHEIFFPQCLYLRKSAGQKLLYRYITLPVQPKGTQQTTGDINQLMLEQHVRINGGNPH